MKRETSGETDLEGHLGGGTEGQLGDRKLYVDVVVQRQRRHVTYVTPVQTQVDESDRLNGVRTQVQDTAEVVEEELSVRKSWVEDFLCNCRHVVYDEVTDLFVM
ncbi:hypothetical protein RvY_11328 [Ramazzottius varieornatus]|uniref:Uncharacterized protein n=1 Tax=Ramazzottius varieornatus TaxID=947166 RepID=A0A1D1VPL9_RAMVA|nr:hypothetical protein RvY_11328 [Ramazzottius varieornatus]